VRRFPALLSDSETRSKTEVVSHSWVATHSEIARASGIPIALGVADLERPSHGAMRRERELYGTFPLGVGT
jgi:hypothetical protein